MLASAQLVSRLLLLLHGSDLGRVIQAALILQRHTSRGKARKTTSPGLRMS
jgi:hypothetical protein